MKALKKPLSMFLELPQIVRTVQKNPHMADKIKF